MPFATFPSVYIHKEPGGKKTEHLLWGDLIEIKGDRQGDWVKVKGRNTVGWMKESDTLSPQLLEIDFVDVGPGDGTFIVTPENKFIMVDAGQRDNLFRFLNWRFNLRKYPDQTLTVDRAIMTHSDWDHSGGFAPFFDDKQFRFAQVYHNGIIERPGTHPLGAIDQDGEHRYLSELIVDQAALDQIPMGSNDAKLTGYLKMLRGARQGGAVANIQMLCSEDGFLPGYEEGRPLTIRVLGPVPETKAGKRRLRWFNDEGKTKNGHSIILKLEYGQVRILLGGDLNTLSEQYLLQHYSTIDPETCHTPAEQERLVQAARSTFEADVAKACHHGSADFTEPYLQAVNPLATVVSSGDDEPYCHPRPDALGAFGKYGRGSRPLIFSTELARSAKEKIKGYPDFRKELNQLIAGKKSAASKKTQDSYDKQIEDCIRKLERNVAVYGMINLRTDGTRVLLAQKLERPAANGDRWDTHVLEPGPDGCLQYVGEH